MNTTLASTVRKAAKAHGCDDCGGVISSGDRYSDATVTGDGRVWTWKSHMLCDSIVDAMNAEAGWALDSDDIFPESVRDDLGEWWDQFAMACGHSEAGR